MRAKSPADWIKAQGALQGAGLGFGPFIDGRLITEAPSEAFSSGRAADVPLIIGANSNEASVLAVLGVKPGAVRLIMGRQMDAFQKLYGAVSETEFARQAMGDITFVAPSRWIAGAAAKGAPSFLYYFSYVTERRRGTVAGANHGTEIPYVFKTWNTPALAAMISDADKKFSATMSACWVAFAKTGQPACDGAPAWPAYDPAKDELMEFAPTISVHKPEKAAAFDMIVAQYAKVGR
jgi:para-nitrobenzyl esterase